MGLRVLTMINFSLLSDFLGSLEPSTWVSSRGFKAGPYAVVLFCGYVLLRDGIVRGFWFLVGRFVAIAVAASLVF